MSSDIDPQGEGNVTEVEAQRLRLFLDGAIGNDRAYAHNTDLAAVAGLAESTIRNARKGLPVSKTTFEKLSRAFGFNKTSQFQATLEQLEKDKELKKSIADEIRIVVADLPEEDQQEFLEMAQKRRERRRNRG